MDISLGHRKKILKAIGQLAAEPTAGAAAFDLPDQSASPGSVAQCLLRPLSVVRCIRMKRMV